MAMKKYSLTLLSLFALLLFPCSLFASWTACLSPYAPDFFFAADKSRGLLLQMEGETPRVSRAFPCIHGRVEGDKEKQGDLRTPEGIYFITRKITQQLDFLEYGPHAFALNYPNPVDRIRRKTGGGIWLHSKGRPIAGLQTRGCLALEQTDICKLLSVLAPGTPLLIAERLEGSSFTLPEPSPQEELSLVPSSARSDAFFSRTNPQELCSLEEQRCKSEEPSAQAQYAEEIRTLTERWVQSWQDAQESIFTLYDPSRFPTGNREKMAALRSRLRKNFLADERIAEDIRVLEGPDYWVSCFSSRSRHGDVWITKEHALYWMTGKSGAFLIVGEISFRR